MSHLTGLLELDDARVGLDRGTRPHQTLPMDVTALWAARWELILREAEGNLEQGAIGLAKAQANMVLAEARVAQDTAPHEAERRSAEGFVELATRTLERLWSRPSPPVASSPPLASPRDRPPGA